MNHDLTERFATELECSTEEVVRLALLCLGGALYEARGDGSTHRARYRQMDPQSLTTRVEEAYARHFRPPLRTKVDRWAESYDNFYSCKPGATCPPPIVVHTEGAVFGNHRLAAAKRLGLESIEVFEVVPA